MQSRRSCGRVGSERPRIFGGISTSERSPLLATRFPRPPLPSFALLSVLTDKADEASERGVLSPEPSLTARTRTILQMYRCSLRFLPSESLEGY